MKHNSSWIKDKPARHFQLSAPLILLFTIHLSTQALLLTITDQLLLLHAASSGKGAADPNPSLGLLSSTLRDMDAAGIHLQRNELRSALGHTPPGTRPASQRPPTTAPVITGSSAHGSGRPAGPAAAAFEEAAGAQVVWRSPDWDGAETPPPGQRRPSDAQLPADNAVDAAAASPPAHTVHTVTSASQEAAPAPEEAPAADAERAAEAEAAAEPAAAADDEAGAVANDAAAEAVPTAAEPAAAEEEAAAADEQQLAEPANAASEAAPADAPAPEASAAPPVAIEAVAEPATGAADAEPLAKAAAEPTAAAPAGADSNGTQRRRSDGDAASLQSSPSNDAHPHSMFAKGASSIDRAVRESSSSIQYVKGLQVSVTQHRNLSLPCSDALIGSCRQCSACEKTAGAFGRTTAAIITIPCTEIITRSRNCPRLVQLHASTVQQRILTGSPPRRRRRSTLTACLTRSTRRSPQSPRWLPPPTSPRRAVGTSRRAPACVLWVARARTPRRRCRPRRR